MWWACAPAPASFRRGPRACRTRFSRSSARSPAAWLAYVATGRRARVERLLRLGHRTLTTTVTPAVEPGDDGWWDMTDGATVDSLCGPGWSFPEPDQGVWSDGAEARLLAPCRGRRTMEIELQVLARFGGPRRSVQVRVDGRPVHTIEATAEPDWPQVIALPLPSADLAEVTFVIRSPARPADLGLNADTRRLGVLVRRVRVR